MAVTWAPLQVILEVMVRSLDVGRNGAPRVSALLVPVLVLLSVMGLADCGSAGTSRAISSLAASALHPPVCLPNDVAASLGSEFNSATGEQDDLFVLTNRSSESCRLDGYPRISLGDHSKRLAFVYEQGGWPYATLRKPQRVLMSSGGHAYFLVAKYRCDGGALNKASVIRISLPSRSGSIVAALTLGGIHELDYCRRYPGDRHVDPGNGVAVSPFEATLHRALVGPIAGGGSGANHRPSLNTASPGATPTFLARATHTCRTSQLKITMGHTFAGLGTAGANIRFINKSTATCELHGWPTLIAETAGAAHAHALDRPGTEFADVSQAGVPTVILKPDQRADAIFEAADGSPSEAPCGPAYRTLRVTPPGNTKNVTISAWIWYLGRFLPSCSAIRLSPVLASTAVYKG